MSACGSFGLLSWMAFENWPREVTAIISSPTTGRAHNFPTRCISKPIRIPVLISTTLANASGCPAAHARPHGPPKSWSTRCARSTPSWSSAPPRNPAGPSTGILNSLPGRSALPNPGMSSAIERAKAPVWPISPRHSSAEFGLPWTNTIASAASSGPVSSTRERTPSTVSGRSRTAAGSEASIAPTLSGPLRVVSAGDRCGEHQRELPRLGEQLTVPAPDRAVLLQEPVPDQLGLKADEVEVLGGRACKRERRPEVDGELDRGHGEEPLHELEDGGWPRVGEHHHEHVVGHLRFVEPDPSAGERLFGARERRGAQRMPRVEVLREPRTLPGRRLDRLRRGGVRRRGVLQLDGRRPGLGERSQRQGDEAVA